MATSNLTAMQPLHYFGCLYYTPDKNTHDVDYGWVASPGTDGVFMIRDGETAVHFVPVQLGMSTPVKTEILTPALDGLVVSLGQHLLEDGSTVILPEEPDLPESPDRSSVNEPDRPAG